MTNEQKEVLKKVFSAYENYAVMSCESGNNEISYMRDVVNTVPELAKVFPAVSLENDEMRVFKRIYFKRRTEQDKHRALLNNCVDDDEAILHKREIKEVRNLND
ncbi:MAG: hypothetical protein KAW56_10885 [Candidatus Marinimicrobia bacterium]|nr:hypothetical protein [Candidatus Neomarinimicrobiota bacterium]